MLAALMTLCVSVMCAGNPWAGNCDGKGTSHRFLTIRLLPQVTKVDGKVITDFNEPEPPQPPAKMEGRILGHGTFAIQGHDPKSRIEYRRIEVKPMP